MQRRGAVVTGLFTICALGFVLGVRHAADADHVVAISTIVARHRSVRGAALIGALWGVGHTLTVLLVGGAIILFRWVIPPRVGLSMELSVGAMLIVLGSANIAAVIKRIRTDADRTPHERSPDQRHDHAPVRWLDQKLGMTGVYSYVRPFVVGVVHGMAGSAAVALLVMATIGRSSWSLLYLLVFGVGTVVGMMVITAAIGVPFARAGEMRPQVGHGLRMAAGVLSLGFGLLIAYQTGWVDGLFRDVARWTPQ
jgi:high-affinity nickel permease